MELLSDNLSIYSYSCPGLFLKDRWAAKKKLNPSFTIRSWSKILGFKNNAPLSLMLNGKRSIPKKYLPRIVKSLKLSSKESNYLELMIDYSSQKDTDSKEYYLQKLSKYNQHNNSLGKEIDEFKYLENPFCTAILEMSSLPDFKLSPIWIKNRLAFDLSVQEIKVCLSLLDKLGLLTLSSENQVIKKYPKITNKKDVHSMGVQNYHQKASQLAAEAVKKQSVDEREFNSYSLNLNIEKIIEAKSEIRKFINQFITTFESNENEGDETYQLNLQLFQLTNNLKEKQ
ncbi:TIGR02147 family protein [Bacteriovoracaceae bacterium]|nr:TIGR02147 family protein [Bacteriovoracaceae bacterium]